MVMMPLIYADYSGNVNDVAALFLMHLAVTFINLTFTWELRSFVHVLFFETCTSLALIVHCQIQKLTPHTEHRPLSKVR
jgi:predicted ABC-type exoprotein transport system permease subunit